MTLLRDLITIPTHVRKGDFVMQLSSGVHDAGATVDSYVVTQQLAEAFNQALAFIASAVSENASKATYLDGSFGAGKSHFMAVLHLLLQGEPHALAIPELAEPIDRHRPQLDGKRFELITFHMIDAESIEQAIFGRYIEHVQARDPGAPLPAVFADEAIFAQADQLRTAMGDELFFDRISGDDGAAPAVAGFGSLGASSAWTAERYDRARGAGPQDPERAALQTALTATLLTEFAKAARASGSNYVDLDRGLPELARHAAASGHDGLIFFLDELMLWLGSRMADAEFIAREAPKLVKLVEAQDHHREIPIISFVARQRDLRSFLSESAPGADKLVFRDALKHWEDRFHTIPLADRNLPKIAERRLLAPKDAAARAAIDAAFAETQRLRPEVLRVLLTDTGDPEQFRSTYPFSPAFMDTLVAASSVLQRERTALRVMLQLLVEQRDALQLGDVVGVGALFDVLSEGSEPFSEEMKQQFAHARRLYDEKLRPMLLATQGITEQEVGTDAGRGFRADDRLIKTLLLAALVDTSALRGLTVGRLVALNHGAITSPIPGQERQLALGRLKTWASENGALRVGDDPTDPTVELRLTGIDVDRILQRVEHVDNDGERRRLAQRLVYSELGLSDDIAAFDTHTVLWRGTRRQVAITFGNIRDRAALPDDVLRSPGDMWRVVIDYPFDPGHQPAEDVARLDDWRASHDPTSTVCWIPAFFSRRIQKDLSKLLLIEYVLGNQQRFNDEHAAHLSAADRATAHGVLADQRSALEARLREAIRQAYGVQRTKAEFIDASHGLDHRIQSLRPGVETQIPIGKSLADAFTGLVGQLLAFDAPRHPEFEVEVRPRDLRTVLGIVQEAAETPDGRIVTPSESRKVMRQIAMPLQLGEQHEAPFVLSDAWKTRFERKINLAVAGGSETVTVGDLRRWIDDPEPWGLTPEVSALLILSYAAQSGRTFQLNGGPTSPTIEHLSDDLTLAAPELPSEPAWEEALRLAPRLFGITSAREKRTAANVESLAARLVEEGRPLQAPVASAAELLARRLDEWGIAADASARLATLRDGVEITKVFGSDLSAKDKIEALAQVELSSPPEHLAAALRTAAEAVAALENRDWWPVLETPRSRSDHAELVAIRERVTAALTGDEFVRKLTESLGDAYRETVAFLQRREPVSPVADPPKPPVADPPRPPVGEPSVVPAGANAAVHRGITVSAALSILEEARSRDGDVVVDLTLHQPQG